MSKKVTEPITSAPDHLRSIITQVLQLERDYLVDDRPSLKEDVVRIIKTCVAKPRSERQ
jgi:hypothetical protein